MPQKPATNVPAGWEVVEDTSLPEGWEVVSGAAAPETDPAGNVPVEFVKDLIGPHELVAGARVVRPALAETARFVAEQPNVQRTISTGLGALAGRLVPGMASGVGELLGAYGGFREPAARAVGTVAKAVGDVFRPEGTERIGTPLKFSVMLLDKGQQQQALKQTLKTALRSHVSHKTLHRLLGIHEKGILSKLLERLGPKVVPGLHKMVNVATGPMSSAMLASAAVNQRLNDPKELEALQQQLSNLPDAPLAPSSLRDIQLPSHPALSDPNLSDIERELIIRFLEQQQDR